MFLRAYFHITEDAPLFWIDTCMSLDIPAEETSGNIARLISLSANIFEQIFVVRRSANLIISSPLLIAHI